MPSGVVRGADVTNFARCHEVVQCSQGFFHRRLRVKSVYLIKIDVVGIEPREAGFTSRDEVVARGALLIWMRTHPEKSFGGDNYILPASFDGCAKNLLGPPR